MIKKQRNTIELESSSIKKSFNSNNEQLSLNNPSTSTPPINKILKETAENIKTQKSYPSQKSKVITRILIKYNVGFPNNLYIRGKGAGLSWEKGLPLKNIKADEWIWETDSLFTIAEFKVLINDKNYEDGLNHLIRCGTAIQYTPKFK